MLTTDQKGAVAELAIARAAAELGIGVWALVHGRTLRLDLRPEAQGLFVCSANGRRGTATSSSVPCYSNRRNRDGLLRTFYSPEEIDAFAAYCADLDRCYFLSLETFARRSAIQLRLAPTKNNQQAGVNWAKDFEFAATLGPRGAIAQLGERLRWQRRRSPVRARLAPLFRRVRRGRRLRAARPTSAAPEPRSAERARASGRACGRSPRVTSDRDRRSSRSAA